MSPGDSGVFYSQKPRLTSKFLFGRFLVLPHVVLDTCFVGSELVRISIFGNIAIRHDTARLLGFGMLEVNEILRYITTSHWSVQSVEDQWTFYQHCSIRIINSVPAETSYIPMLLLVIGGCMLYPIYLAEVQFFRAPSNPSTGGDLWNGANGNQGVLWSMVKGRPPPLWPSGYK